MLRTATLLAIALLAPGVAHAEIPVPVARPDVCEYDARHRLLLSDEVRSRLPDRCIEALDGDYPYPRRGLAGSDRPGA